MFYLKRQRQRPAKCSTLLILPLALMASSWALAETPGPVTVEAGANSQTALEYWTEERMRNARPMDRQAVVRDSDSPMVLRGPGMSEPGYVPGWAPGSGPQPDPLDRVTIYEDDDLYDLFMGEISPMTWGSASFNPTDWSSYGPFHRHTHFGKYTTYPMSTIGKLFFSQGGGNFVCSASVIGRSTIVTAGHCVSDGNGNFNTNFLFCPSYRKGPGSGEPHPDRGCWGWSSATTSTQYHNSANVDYDYGCIVTQTTGDTVSNKVGNVTGWTGRAWGGSIFFHQIAMGYPAGSPFPGYHIVACNGTEWYEVQRAGSADGQKSKYIGCDMTGGSSGGPWWFGLRHPNGSFNYPDTDGSNVTAPWVGSAMIRGLNSHARCQNSCYTPPNASGGTYFQEMGSPYFQSTAAHNNSSESVFEICLNHANNDA
ncbi:MAG: trypsin-like serine protease [Pseudomonadota bacterium]|nr:MAG: trypsin-like serine protease [Pseudomonadota bacterium]